MSPKHRAVLIRQYLPWAYSIAHRVLRTLSKDADREEIRGYARLGLWEAVLRFNWSYKIAFERFAFYRIRGAIFDGLRKNLWGPRTHSTRDRLHFLGMDPNEVSAEFPDTYSPSAEQQLNSHQISELLRSAIEDLPHREKQLIHLYYFEDNSLREAGKKLSLSTSWVSRLHGRILRDLHHKLSPGVCG